MKRLPERVNEETAAVRNKMMLKLAEEVVVGYASEGGALIKLMQKMAPLKYDLSLSKL